MTMYRNRNSRYRLVHHKSFKTEMRQQDPDYFRESCIRMLEDMHRVEQGLEPIWEGRFSESRDPSDISNSIIPENSGTSGKSGKSDKNECDWENNHS